MGVQIVPNNGRKIDKVDEMMSEWIGSPDSSYASSSASDCSTESPRCEISLLERLIRTHPLWFLPSLQRSGALHLLQGRDIGNFIVRSSRQPKTMAVSVKLPGNLVEHYLLKATGTRISLENSYHSFPTVHQLIAHYCDTSDEIPVCLRVPSAIAEATSRQQLRSLALLGQEFWSISSGCGTMVSSPTDLDGGRNPSSSGLGSSQSSSSQNSLTDTAKNKPCRPTTLELGASRPRISLPMTTTPPAVPLRWTRSAFLTPLSQPSSVQSTPSEVQSTISEKSGKRKKKRNSGGNVKSIHYKDTEILDLFKGTKTVYADKASDYEDVWSPSYFESSHTPRLTTFKPDVIPKTLLPEVLENIYPNLSQTPTPTSNSLNLAMIQNHLNRNSSRSPDSQNSEINQLNQSHSQYDLKSKLKQNQNVNRSNPNVSKLEHDNEKLYSEPIDSLAPRSNLPTKEPNNINIRWSQPALSLPKVDIFDTSVNQDHCSDNFHSEISDTASKRSIKDNWKKVKANFASVENLYTLKESNYSRIQNDIGISKDEVADTNVTIKCGWKSQNCVGLGTPTTHNSKCWRLDDSWEFKYNSDRIKENSPDLYDHKNYNRSRSKDEVINSSTSSDDYRYEEQDPTSPSEWENLLRLVSESTLQLDSLNTLNVSHTQSRSSNPTKPKVYDAPKEFKVNPSENVLKAGRSVSDAVTQLAFKNDGVFGPTLQSFISCTIAMTSKAQTPYKVMRNVRQFISGMKNYLVGANSETDHLRKEIKKQTEYLSESEFLNIDIILEEVLVDLVISPLYPHILKLIRDHDPESSKLPSLTRDRYDSNINHNQNPYSKRLDKFRNIYKDFETSFSPMKKLDKWKEFVFKVKEMDNYSSESFLHLLSETLGCVCTSGLPSHVDIMIGLLPPSIADQNNYSLSLLQSAVGILKSRTDSNCTSLPSIRVLIPDERNGTLMRKMIPVRDTTTNKEVAKILASKLGIINPTDYVLVNVRNGEENLCPEGDLVNSAEESGPGSVLAYKRLDAKIGWPHKIVN